MEQGERLKERLPRVLPLLSPLLGDFLYSTKKGCYFQDDVRLVKESW